MSGVSGVSLLKKNEKGKKMDDLIYCKNCVSMPSKLTNGEYKTWKGQCKSGDPFWHPDLQMRCPSFKKKGNVSVNVEVKFWE